MSRPGLTSLVRLGVLCTLVAGVLLLGTRPAAWAAPPGQPQGQTVPTATPGGATIPPVTEPVIPPPPDAVREVVAPGVTSIVEIGDGVTIVIPADALAQPGTMQARVVPTAALPPAPANASFTILRQAVEITLFDQNGQPIANPTFTNPIQVCIAFPPDALAQAQARGQHLVVRSYDTRTGAWVELPTTVDAQAGRACGAVTHLTLFGLTAERAGGVAAPQGATLQAATVPEAGGPAALPTTGGSDGAPLPLWLLAVPFAILAGGLLLRRIQSGRG
ncbi:MAG TPA: hypothetical protein VNL77_08755 [Roseiflexaceae bacterium]|nr:hypothetical protein [Roseiflexaceae bacterium]